jgi:hypothetical protein
MSSHACLDCDSIGDGSCPVCHGIGMLSGDSASGAYGESGGRISCASCNGSGECQKCDGSGQVEVGGEG